MSGFKVKCGSGISQNNEPLGSFMYHLGAKLSAITQNFTNLTFQSNICEVEYLVKEAPESNIE